MVKEQRKRHRKRKRRLRIVFVILIVLAIAFLVVWKGFVVKKVTVKGNALYADKQIEDWVLNDQYSWNSLYVFFKYKLMDTKEIPFVDSIEVSLSSPRSLQLSVYEKGVLGYVYISSLGENAYFDKDGFVVELSKDVIEDTTKIAGLSVASATLYEKLPLEDTAILKTLLNVSRLLKKNECVPEVIFITDTQDVILSYGNIQVNVGGNVYLNEKIARMQQIMPKLKKLKGTLHLEEWSETNTDIYFTKNKLTDIPKDVQTVPTTDTTKDASEDAAKDGKTDTSTKDSKETQ